MDIHIDLWIGGTQVHVEEDPVRDLIRDHIRVVERGVALENFGLCVISAARRYSSDNRALPKATIRERRNLDATGRVPDVVSVYLDASFGRLRHDLYRLCRRDRRARRLRRPR